MPNDNRIKVVYETVFALLAVFSIGMLISDLAGNISLDTDPFWYQIDLAIVIIFAVDYFTRLILAKNKKAFIRNNIPDLIAIIPFSAMFKAFRLAKLFELLPLAKFVKGIRIFVLLVKLNRSASVFLKTNGLIYMLMITACLIILGALGIFMFERHTTVETFGDAIWWSFVTATTVGYGDISPSTSIGRIIASLLMLCGIGTISLLTGTIATYFMSGHAETKKRLEQVVDLTDLSEEKFDQVMDYIDYIKSK